MVATCSSKRTDNSNLTACVWRHPCRSPKFDPVIARSRLRCRPAAALQRGSEQFKVSFDNLRKAFTESSWARENILIAIAGSETDGTSGVRDGADATLRQEMEKFAHIIFASSAAQRDFWLGRRNLSFPKIISGRNGGAARTRSGDCRPRQRLPPRLGDAHPRHLARWPRPGISQKSGAGPQHSVSHERWCVEAEEPMMGSVE